MPCPFLAPRNDIFVRSLLAAGLLAGTCHGGHGRRRRGPGEKICRGDRLARYHAAGRRANVGLWRGHAALSQGQLDPLMAKAIVVQAGPAKVAIVGTDIGRGPTQWMMEQIRKEIKEKAGIEHVMISGSHSHHGPVIELVDRDGFGRGKFDDAVAYSKRLPELLIEAILEADRNAKPAKLGVATPTSPTTATGTPSGSRQPPSRCWP